MYILNIDIIIDIESIARQDFLGEDALQDEGVFLYRIVQALDLYDTHSKKKEFLTDAGNAAHFVMKSAMVLALRERNNSNGDPPQIERPRLVRALATSSLEKEFSKTNHDYLAAVEQYNINKRASWDFKLKNKYKRSKERKGIFEDLPEDWADNMEIGFLQSNLGADNNFDGNGGVSGMLLET